MDDERGITVGWFVMAAMRDPEHMERVGHRYYAAEGQPHYASVGMLLTNLDALRGIGTDTQWSDD